MSENTHQSLTQRAFAKINLTLDVGARRPDGYHEIQSVMQTISLHDTVTIQQTPDRPGIRLEIWGNEAGDVPADASNLVHQAAVRLQKTAAARGLVSGNRSGLHIVLEKQIPSQAGLGGGSSDAAATVRLLDTLFGLGLSREKLGMIGAALGADVAFFLTGGTALAEGLGEQITPLSPLEPAWDLVIVKPPVGISTAWAYGALDSVPARVPGVATARWLRGKQRASNDFERVALTIPEVASAWAFLHDASERVSETPPLLCGSGSALWCRVHDAGAAARLAARSVCVGKAWIATTCGAGE